MFPLAWVELLVLEALVGTNALEAWKAWVETNLVIVLLCPTMRWNHCFMGWGGWPLEAMDNFLLMCSMRTHIHAWNMAWGWMTKERFGSAILRSGGTCKSHPSFGFFIVNERLFLFVFLWVLWWIGCGVYGCGFIDIFVPIMLVMYMFYESSHVWLSSCFYL